MENAENDGHDYNAISLGNGRDMLNGDTCSVASSSYCHFQSTNREEEQAATKRKFIYTSTGTRSMPGRYEAQHHKSRNSNVGSTIEHGMDVEKFKGNYYVSRDSFGNNQCLCRAKEQTCSTETKTELNESKASKEQAIVTEQFCRLDQKPSRDTVPKLGTSKDGYDSPVYHEINECHRCNTSEI